MYDVFDFTLRKKSMIFDNGKWERHNSRKATTVIDYCGRFGKAASIPINFYELDDLPGKLGIDYLGCYGAIADIRLYFILKRLLAFLYNIKPRLGWPFLARLLLYYSKKNNKEPEGFSLVVDAWENEMNQKPGLRLIMEHWDYYYITAVITMLFIKEYLAGTYSRMYGIHFMGHIVSTRIIDALTDFRVNLEIVER
jgi:hypothetical protein